MSRRLGLVFMGMVVGCADGAANGKESGDTGEAFVPDVWGQPVGDEVGNITSEEGWEAPVLLPEPANVPDEAGWTDSLTADSTGAHLLFGYARWDFGAFYDGLNLEGNLVLDPTGPTRAGVEEDAFQLFGADLGADGWSVSAHAANLGGGLAQASPGLSADGTLLVSTVFEFEPSYSAKLHLARWVDGAWVDEGALPAPLNAGGCTNDNGFLVGDAEDLTLYFESNRDDVEATSCGAHAHLFRSRRVGGAWGDVEPMATYTGAGADDDDLQPAIAADGSLVFTGTRAADGLYALMRAAPEGDGFASPTPFLQIASFAGPWEGQGVLIGEPTIVSLPEGELVYFICAVATKDGSDGALAPRIGMCRSRHPG